MAKRLTLLVPVPAAERHVYKLRRAHDPAALAGIPAHVTLLHPFLTPERLGRAVRSELRALFAATPAFRFRLERAARFPGALYLAPEPASPFVRLTEALVRAWPEVPPYGGAYESIVPHLTVAQGSAAEAELARELGAALPIDASAREVWLMLEDSGGRWWRDQVYPLA